MRNRLVWALALSPSGCAIMQMGSRAVSVLVDLDPVSTDRTVIVESVVADQYGRLLMADWLSGNILRVDPHGVDADARRTQTRDYMERVGLDGFGEHYPPWWSFATRRSRARKRIFCAGGRRKRRKATGIYISKMTRLTLDAATPKNTDDECREVLLKNRRALSDCRQGSCARMTR